MNDETVVRAAPDLEIRAAGSETVVLVPATERVHVLNATAGRTLALADGSRDVAAIATIVAAETGAAVERVRADMTAFVRELVALGILRAADAAAGRADLPSPES